MFNYILSILLHHFQFHLGQINVVLVDLLLADQNLLRCLELTKSQPQFVIPQNLLQLLCFR